jgi:hypothetical protein
MPRVRQYQRVEAMAMNLTLKLALRSLLHGGLDLLIGSTLLKTAGQVNNGNVGGWDTHGHASELAIELWDDLSDSLSGTGAAGNDVLGSGTASTPILSRWTINSLLGSGVGVDGGHQTFDNTELVVDNLGQRSKAVSCAGSIGDDVNVSLVGLLVDTHHEHRGISRRSRDDNLLGTTLQVSLGLLGGGEDTSRLHDVVCAGLAPWDVCWVALRVELDLLAIDLQSILEGLDLTLEETVSRVVLQHISLQARTSQLVSIKA